MINIDFINLILIIADNTFGSEKPGNSCPSTSSIPGSSHLFAPVIPSSSHSSTLVVSDSPRPFALIKSFNRTNFIADFLA